MCSLLPVQKRVKLFPSCSRVSMKPRKVELLQMQEQGCVLLPLRPMHGGRSIFGGNFGRGSLSDIEKFRAKLPRELVIQRERGEEKFLVRRRFDLV